MTGERNDTLQSKAAMRALSLVTEAMDLLDAHGVAPEASAHLAVAQEQLRGLKGAKEVPSPES